MISDVEPNDLVLLRREVQLQRRLKELSRENGILLYTPHPKQESFHSAANFHYRYARTGNRFGKSEMGAAEDVAYALGYRPWIPEGNPLRILGIPSHATKGLIICVTWKKSREVFTEEEQGNLGKLWRYIPKSALIDYSPNHSGFIDRIIVKHISGDRSVIMLDTVEGYKNNKLAQESSVHDWVHIDEPIPQGMWKSIVRGLTDRKGHAWFTCTPLSEPWIDEMFFPDVEDQTQASLATTSDVYSSQWRMTGEMDDNPYLDAEAIRLTMSNYTLEEQETRRKGIPVGYAGLVFKEFDYNIHVLREGLPPGWKSWDSPPENYCVRFAIDYHFRKNDAVLFLATSPQDITYIYAELWEQMLLVDEVLRIKSVLSTHATQPGLVDPLASTPNKMTDITAMDEYRRLGLPVLPATKDPVNGIRAVKATLKARDKHGKPVLVINPACRRTIFEISRGFIWDGDENKPVKKNDDMMENLHRLCLQGLQYIEPSGLNDYSVIPKLSSFGENVVDARDFFPKDVDSSPKFDRQKRYAR